MSHNNALGKGGKSCKINHQRKSAISRSLRAGLQFPVGRLHRYLKNKINYRNRVGTTASVFISATLEYLTAEILELAGNATRNFKTKRITPRHL